jgi:hypothetical protein
MANPDSVLNGQGDALDLVVQADGTPVLKAGGVAIVVAGGGDASAPQLTTDFAMLTGHGHQVVAAGPTRAALRGSATPCHRLTLKANVANTAVLYVGLSGVTANTNNTTGGFQLSPGEFLSVAIDDVNKVYIHGTAGEGCSFVYEL